MPRRAGSRASTVKVASAVADFPRQWTLATGGFASDLEREEDETASGWHSMEKTRAQGKELKPEWERTERSAGVPTEPGRYVGSGAATRAATGMVQSSRSFFSSILNPFDFRSASASIGRQSTMWGKWRWHQI